MMSIKATFTPGDDISDAFREAIDFATRNGVCVEFDFNGVTCRAYRFGSVEESVERYNKSVEIMNKIDGFFRGKQINEIQD